MRITLCRYGHWMLTSQEVASLLGLSVRAVRRLYRSGDMHAMKWSAWGRGWYVNLYELVYYAWQHDLVVDRAQVEQMILSVADDEMLKYAEAGYLGDWIYEGGEPDFAATHPL